MTENRLSRRARPVRTHRGGHPAAARIRDFRRRSSRRDLGDRQPDHRRRHPFPALRAHRLDAARRDAGIAALVPLLVVDLRRRSRTPSTVAACCCSPTSRCCWSPAACSSMRSCRIPASGSSSSRKALGTAAYGFQRPASNALTPRLVREDQLLPAIAVEDVIFTLARTGPVMGGGLISVVGSPAPSPSTSRPSRLAVRDLAAAAGSARARRRPAEPSLDRGRIPYVFRKGAARDLRGRHERDDLQDAARALPALAEKLGGGAGTLGLLYAGTSVGALLASLTSGWMMTVRRQGVGVCIAAAAWASRSCSSASRKPSGSPWSSSPRQGADYVSGPPLEHPAHGDAGPMRGRLSGHRARAGGGRRRSGTSRPASSPR